MTHFEFRQMSAEDIPIFISDIFAILAGNMRTIAPTGSSYKEDFEIWSGYAVPAWREGKSRVILIFQEAILCGYFQYSIDDTTFRMEEIQFKQQYQGCGLFSELYHYLTTVIPVQTKYVDAYADKNNKKSQGILKEVPPSGRFFTKYTPKRFFSGIIRVVIPPPESRDTRTGQGRRASRGGTVSDAASRG